jgi:hypothetical protein
MAPNNNNFELAERKIDVLAMLVGVLRFLVRLATVVQTLGIGAWRLHKLSAT